MPSPYLGTVGGWKTAWSISRIRYNYATSSLMPQKQSNDAHPTREVAKILELLSDADEIVSEKDMLFQDNKPGKPRAIGGDGLVQLLSTGKDLG